MCCDGAGVGVRFLAGWEALPLMPAGSLSAARDLQLENSGIVDPSLLEIVHTFEELDLSPASPKRQLLP